MSGGVETYQQVWDNATRVASPRYPFNDSPTLGIGQWGIGKLEQHDQVQHGSSQQQQYELGTFERESKLPQSYDVGQFW